MTNCDDLQAELSAYIDGELSPEEKNALEAHLIGCESCNAVLAELEEARSAVAGMRRYSAPDSLTQNIRRGIAVPPLSDRQGGDLPHSGRSETGGTLKSSGT